MRDDPAARLELIARTYHGPIGSAPRHLPFRRAALSFMRWQLSRGVLALLNAAPPVKSVVASGQRAAGARWLRGCRPERRDGRTPSSHTVDLWMFFVAAPTSRTWYRAHNASIVSAYLDHRDLPAARAVQSASFSMSCCYASSTPMPWSRRRVWRSGGSRRSAPFSAILASR